MKKAAILFLLVNSLMATAKPLIIRGKLSNSPERKLYIGFYDDHHVVRIDTIFLNADGTFLFQTDLCTRPQQTSIQQNSTQINNIFVAPGYDLHITGDATSFATLQASVRITGKGAASNRYRELWNDWYKNHPPDTAWYERSKKGIVQYAKHYRQITDSLAQIAFSGPVAKDDVYFEFFKRSVALDNAFIQLYYLLVCTEIYQLSAADSEELLASNVDRKLWADLDNDAYLISNQYKTWVIAKYRDYLVRLDELKDPARKQEEFYPLKKTAQIYSGKVRDLALYRKMSNEVESCESLERLHALGDHFKPYLPYFTDNFYWKSLAEKVATRAEYLAQTSIGKPAPPFTLNNEHGQAYSLNDFKGKVIYIDLWASWCAPCREETPFLEAVYDQYKNDSRIAIISIAVADGRQAWLNALKKDKPTWLQLIDSEGKVQAAYNAIMIPRFVIINKKGEIVNFNAPQPSRKDELVRLLEKEMAL
jgi:thiol-disulfide isomerase/thioredoxin